MRVRFEDGGRQSLRARMAIRPDYQRCGYGPLAEVAEHVGDTRILLVGPRFGSRDVEVCRREADFLQYEIDDLLVYQFVADTFLSPTWAGVVMTNGDPRSSSEGVMCGMRLRDDRVFGFRAGYSDGYPPDTSIAALAITDAGAVVLGVSRVETQGATPVREVVVADGDAPNRVVDSAPDIDFGSVGTDGSAATWLRGGAPQSAPTRGRYLRAGLGGCE